MKRDRAFLSTISILFLLYGGITRASESYFAQDFIRGLFSITVEQPLLHTHQMSKEVERDFPQKIKLLVWNIQKGESIQKKRLPFSLKAYDFVLLQENIWKWSIKNLPYRGTQYFFPTFSQSKQKTGISFISLYRPQKILGYHTQYYEPFIISPKSFLVAEFETMAIINVHALNFVPLSEWLFELKRITRIAGEIIKGQKALVVAGDFNSWSEERYENLKKEFRNIGLQEIAFKDDKRTKVLGLPLDGVFTYGFRLRDSNVFALEEFSDHNALEVILELKSFN